MSETDKGWRQFTEGVFDQKHRDLWARLMPIENHDPKE